MRVGVGEGFGENGLGHARKSRTAPDARPAILGAVARARGAPAHRTPMDSQILILGLANTLRPTAAAVVYALLAGTRPRRSLLAYLAAGAVFSIAVGVLVVGLTHGVQGFERTGTRSNIVDVIVGVGCIGFAAGLVYGRPGEPQVHRESARRRAWMARLENPSLGVAAAAGVVTHLPGLFYLAGLNAIVAEQLGFAAAVSQVLVFNAVWYSTGVAAFVAFLARPQATLSVVDRSRRWLAAHNRALGAGLFALVGLYLCVGGAVRLVG